MGVVHPKRSPVATAIKCRRLQSSGRFRIMVLGGCTMKELRIGDAVLSIVDLWSIMTTIPAGGRYTVISAHTNAELRLHARRDNSGQRR